MPAPITTDVQHAARVLRDGGLVAFATETVYGLGANALDVRTVARIFAAKQRPEFDPLIVHVADRSQVGELVAEVPALAQRLMDRFWPGPLTLVLPKREIIPDLVTAGLTDVGIRLPAHSLAQQFLRACGVPVAAPSANPFGGISPTTAQHVLDGLGEQIDLVLDGGPCAVGLESTVLRVPAQGPAQLLRAGGLTRERIEAEIGPISSGTTPASAVDAPQAAPGMLSRHYAPGKPIQFVADWSSAPRGKEYGALSFRTLLPRDEFGAVEVLSASGNLEEAAAGFFAGMRRLDAAPVSVILAEWFPEEGLGIPLNDRLRRAAAS